MPRINTYDLDTTPSLSDKWIGTDSATTTTKNFTVSSIINLINSSSAIDHFDGVTYEFKAIDSENPNPTGVICVTATNVLATAFSAINNIFVSKVHATGDDVTAYLQAMDNDTIKINQAGNLNAFGIFKVTNVQTYSSDSNFLQFTLTYQSGNGSLTPNERYFISNYQAIENIDFATKSVTDLGDVTGAGSGSIITTQERGIVGNALVHTDVVDNLTSTSTDVPLSAKQGKTLNDAIVSINTLLSSDEATLDTLQEIVDYIQLNRTDLNNLGITSIAGLQTALAGKVDTVAGKGLSANDFTDTLLTKLNGIADGAEVNVQSNWSETNTGADSFILNKPTDLTDLSTHSVTDLSDVLGAGSGYIITDSERTKLTGIDVNATTFAITDGTDSVTVTPQARTIELAGTSNEVEVSPTGAQDLTANRTFTVGLPNDVTIGNNLTVTDDLLSKTIISKYISTTKTYTVTVATKASTHRYYNSGSTSGYVIDGVPAPYITLTPGNTYRFDMSDTTNSTHPLHFFYNSDKSTPTGLSSNKYITGVTDNYSSNAPGQNGSYIEIVADENTPTVLHYMCDSHPLMGNAVNFNTRNLTNFSIDALVDVDLTSVANDKILKYNSSTGKFEVADESGGTVTETFKTIAVTGTSGQSDVVADTATDTLTFNAGSGMSITTNASNDTIEFASTATGGADLGTLNAATIDVTADSFGFIDSSDSNNSKKDTIASLVSAIAGTNLTASNGQLNAQAAGVGTVTVEKNVYAGDGTTTAFATTTAIANENNVQVYIDGVYQSKNNYTTSGSTVTFSPTAPANGTSVELIHMVSTSGVIARDTFTGDNTTTAFTLSMSISNENATQVYIDGVYQSKDNYTTSGSVLTFNTAPATGTSIEVVHIKAVNATSINQNNFTGNGSSTFTLSQSIDDEAKTFVFIQGVYQEKSTYSISGNQITFTTAPQTGFTVEVMAFDSITVGNQTAAGTDWQATIQTSNFTAEAGKGYFVNTTSSAVTVSLPAGTAGDEIHFTDYAGTFDTNEIIFDSNGTEKILGSTDDHKCVTENATVRLIYQDNTNGWTADNIETTITSFAVHHLVVGGGGGSHVGNYQGATYGYNYATRFYTGGGGGGGFRTSISADGNGGGQSADSQIVVTPGTNYTVTVGDGGATTGTQDSPGGNNDSQTFANNNGKNSVFSTIIALGGGYGGGYGATSGLNAGDGGSGGGASSSNPSYGNKGQAVSTINSVNAGSIHGTDGEDGSSTDGGGAGGGGAGGAGNAPTGTNSRDAGVGGLPKASTITGSTVYYAAGGNGSRGWNGSDSSQPANRTNGANSGDGGLGGCNGGGGGSACDYTHAAGKKGIVILRYPSGNSVNIPSGSGLTTGVLNATVSGSSTDKYTTFTGGTGTITFS